MKITIYTVITKNLFNLQLDMFQHCILMGMSDGFEKRRECEAAG